jgi:hypothetical protein
MSSWSVTFTHSSQDETPGNWESAALGRQSALRLSRSQKGEHGPNALVEFRLLTESELREDRRHMFVDG